ncbi:hypothetical protein J5N97_005882 [Dioscorea zingiberensis]|uniref:Cation/H+ exchanger domain-containing protein n=1 Tax=Dioscorea zingiberensis TaxID=325984 RepID=A0A9D5HT33_9LILI|nr:hypothetical protein J5N97_005882 [Dioscorea zingiberensis]
MSETQGFTQELHCTDDGSEYGDLLHLIMRMAIVISISHVLHLFLQRLGQPSAIAQILAGIIVGPSVLGHIPQWRERVFDPDKSHLMGAGMMIGRMVLMFLIGIEMDVEYLWRTANRAMLVAGGGCFSSIFLAAVLTTFLHANLGSSSGTILFGCTIALLFANTATPVVVRIAAELKLAHSEIGRLAISAALVNDMFCLLVLSIASFTASETGHKQKLHHKLAGTAVMITMLATVIGVMRLFVSSMNRRFLRRRLVGNWHAVGVLAVVLGMSSLTEMMGYNNMMACFILGLFFPREGGAARTMVDWLTYPVNNFILPIYFAYAGFHTNLLALGDAKLATAVAAIVILSTVGKVAGTVMVTGLLDIPTHEGLVLGFLLNVKGHVHLIVLNVAKKIGMWNYTAYTALLMTLVLNTLLAGPVAAAIVSIRRRALHYRAMGLQHHQLKTELRMLTCIHGPREMTTMFSLIEMSSGTAFGSSITAFMMHLVELTQRVTTTMLYHEGDDDSDSHDDDWEYGGDDSRRIHHATDAFWRETGLKVRLITTVSSFTSMHEDVCNAAEDMRAAIIVMPFHKHQRIDGKMQAGKEGIQALNEKVLRRAPCTVGILVDRGLGSGATHASKETTELQHCVVVLFFGGADDREALALAGRIATHPCVSLTVVRFLPASSMKQEDTGIKEENASPSTEEEVRMPISEPDCRRDEDESFLQKFHERFVEPGVATYVEKYVEDGAQTVTEICSMVGSYSLFMVGKEREGPSPLTVGLSDWEECPELGVIGDLLASSDFMLHGSVLVLQRGRTKKEDLVDEFM